VLKKRLAQNFGANLFAQFTNVLVQLASVPLFLTFWSKERYGAWLLISAIPAYLSLGEAGFATSSANEVSMAIAQNDRQRALRSLHTAWGFLVGISAALLVLTGMAFFAIPWDAWLKTSSVTGNEARWTISLLSLYSIAGILVAIFGTIYRAAYRNARGTYLPTGARLMELAAMGAGVALTSSMITIAGLMLAVRLLAFLVMYVDSRSFSPDLNLGFSGFSVAELKVSWRPSMMFMAATLGNAFYFQGLTLLVGASLGAVAVVVFNTTRTLSRVIAQFVSMIKHSVWPEFSYLFGSGDMIRARRLNEQAFEASWVASIGLALGIFIAAPWIMPVWTHHAVQVDPLLLAIFLASAVLNGLWFVTSGLIMGINQHEGLTLRYLMAATLALVLAAVSVHFLGIYGVALAMIVCELILLPYAISRTCQLLQQPVRELLFGSMQLRAVRQAATGYYQRWLAKAG
jgi:O-antigen/teichoic acid export membrane protein